MTNNIDISKILFLDIETVSGKAEYKDLDDNMQHLWQHKAKYSLRKYDEEITEEEAATVYKNKAGIYSEFGKIICISVGIIVRDKDKKLSLRLKSFADDDEKVVLQEFTKLLNQYYNNLSKHFFCGHNIREFDIPYICRRLIINQLPLSNLLNIAGKKPWETKHMIDTLELWKFGDYKHYTSLKLLATILGFPSPKDDIDGSDVSRVYWEENDLKRISTYCEKDVLATVQLYLRYNLMPILDDEQVIFIE